MCITIIGHRAPIFLNGFVINDKCPRVPKFIDLHHQYQCGYDIGSSANKYVTYVFESNYLLDKIKLQLSINRIPTFF